MADNERELLILLQLKDELSKGLKDVKTSVSGIEKQTEAANKTAAGFTNTLKNIAKVVGLAVVTKQIFNMGKAALNTAKEFEQHNVAFKTMLGDADKAKKLLGEIKTFAKQTPFELPGIVTSAKQLLAFNVAAEDIVPTLTVLGNIAAGVGKPVGQLANVFGQVKLAGRLMGQDLMQFTNAGVPLIAQLAKNFGTTEAAIKKMVEGGKIGFKDVEKALTDLQGPGGKFFNLMIAQSKTLGGVLSNIGDTFIQIGLAIGDAMLPIAKIIAQDVLEAVGKLQDWFEDNQAQIQEWFVNAYASFKTLIQVLNVLGKTVYTWVIEPWVKLLSYPIVQWLAGIVAVVWLLFAAFAALQAVNPFVWIVLGVALATAAIKAIIDNWNTFKKVAIEALKYIAAFMMGGPVGVAILWLIKNFDLVKKGLYKAFTDPIGTIKAAWNALLKFFINAYNKIAGFFGKLKGKQAANKASTADRMAENEEAAGSAPLDNAGADTSTGSPGAAAATAGGPRSFTSEGLFILRTVSDTTGAEEMKKSMEEVSNAIISVADTFTNDLVGGIVEGTVTMSEYWNNFTMGVQEAFLMQMFEPIKLGMEELGLAMYNVMDQTIGQLINPITSFVGTAVSMIAQMFQKFILQTLGFQKFFTTITLLLGQAWTAMTNSMLGQWIIGLLAMVWSFLSTAGALILGFALVAASAAASAVAMIPIIGPVLAPIAYFATFALVIAGVAQLAGLAVGLAGGTTEVIGGDSGDTVPAMLTPGEMVIPKSMAQGIRDGDVALGDTGTNAAAGSTTIVNVIMDGLTIIGTMTDDMVADLAEKLGEAIKNRMVAPFPTGA